jgi:ADP-ribose pyrophosphatase
LYNKIKYFYLEYDVKYTKDPSEFTEKTISSRCYFEGKVLRVFCDEISLPNGKTSFREYNKHKGAVCVIPVTDEGEIICVRQYRYAVGQITLEIPAGKLDYVGEDPESAARRELREETGATAEKITYLGKYLGSPAILDETIHMYLAEGLTFGETDFDEDEFIEIVKMPISELVDMVMRDEIHDAKTQIAILKAKKILG